MFLIPIIPAAILLTTLFLFIAIFLIESNYKWPLKAVVIVWTLAASYFSYQAVSNSFGWPYSHDLPEKFRLIWAYSENKHIYAWIIIKNVPRVYEIPYSKDMENAVKELQQQVSNNKNQPIYVEKSNSKEQGKEKEIQNPAGGLGNEGTSFATGNGQEYHVRSKMDILPQKGLTDE